MGRVTAEQSHPQSKTLGPNPRHCHPNEWHPQRAFPAQCDGGTAESELTFLRIKNYRNGMGACL